MSLHRSLITGLMIAASVGSACNVADAQKFEFKGLTGLAGGSKSGIDYEFSLLSSDPKTGGTAVLAIKVKLPETSYIYSQNPEFSGKTELDATSTGLTAIDPTFVANRSPKVVEDEFLGKLEKFHGGITWLRRYRISGDADLEAASITGTLKGQHCSDLDGTCIPIRPAKKFTVTLAKGAPELLDGWSTTPVEDGRLTQSIVPKNRRDKDEPVEFTISLPAEAKVGDVVELQVKAAMEGKWHIYSTSTAEDLSQFSTTIKVSEHAGLDPVDSEFTADRKPVRHFDENLEEWSEYFEKSIVWTRKYKVTSDDYSAAGTIKYLLCDDNVCLIPVTFSFGLQAEAPQVSAEPPPPGSPEAPTNLFRFLVTAAIAGFAALLTPCVFPMVPITVSFFLKQSENGTGKPVAMASVYCLSIIGTFTILGMLMAVFFGATSLNALVNNAWLNLVLAAVLVFFGCNLLGLFEIRVPSSLLTWSARKEGSGGYIGIVFMALTFTLVSFTCTFAFLGLLLVWAANGEYYWPILGLLSFSAAFSLPFFFLALFPSYLNKLPSSGGWMNRVKATMGMIEFAAAFKFLSTADFSANSFPVAFSYEVVMWSWTTISLLTAAYLFGLIRLPHDVKGEKLSVTRGIFAGLFLGLGVSIPLAMFEKPHLLGPVWNDIHAFAPPKLDVWIDDELGLVSDHDGLLYSLEFERAQQKAKESNTPLFLDFTGVNCPNCRKMEHTVFGDPEVHDLLAKFTRIQLYTDSVPGVADAEKKSQLLEGNRDKQAEWFGDVTLPAYAIVTPDGRQLAALKGLNSKEKFHTFLKDGLSRWKEAETPTADNGTVTSEALAIAD